MDSFLMLLSPPVHRMQAGVIALPRTRCTRGQTMGGEPSQGKCCCGRVSAAPRRGCEDAVHMFNQS